MRSSGSTPALGSDNASLLHLAPRASPQKKPRGRGLCNLPTLSSARSPGDTGAAAPFGPCPQPGRLEQESQIPDLFLASTCRGSRAGLASPLCCRLAFG